MISLKRETGGLVSKMVMEKIKEWEDRHPRIVSFLSSLSSFFGFSAILLLYLFIFHPVPLKTSILSFYQEQNLNSYVNPNSTEVEELSSSIIANCSKSFNKEQCFLDETYNYLNKFEYDSSLVNKSKVMSPSWVLDNKSYICDSATVTLCSVLRNLNISCMPAITEGHALAIVTLENKSTLMDLTAGGFGYGSVNKFIVGLS